MRAISAGVFKPLTFLPAGPFTKSLETKLIKITNRSQSWVVCQFSLIATSRVPYATTVYRLFQPGQQIDQQCRFYTQLIHSAATYHALVIRKIMETDPHLKHRQDMLCIESIVLPQEPTGTAPADIVSHVLWVSVRSPDIHFGIVEGPVPIRHPYLHIGRSYPTDSRSTPFRHRERYPSDTSRGNHGDART